MKYLNRLKKELAYLTDILTPKGPLPEYVSIKALYREEVLQLLIKVVREVRAIDRASSNWSSENAEEWSDFLNRFGIWLARIPVPQGFQPHDPEGGTKNPGDLDGRGGSLHTRGRSGFWGLSTWPVTSCRSFGEVSQYPSQKVVE